MGDLYPSKTRIQLLKDCADEYVWFSFDTDNSYCEAPPEYRQVKVNARIDELEAAGWVYIPPGRSRWTPTDAGRAVLAAASHSTQPGEETK